MTADGHLVPKLAMFQPGGVRKTTRPRYANTKERLNIDASTAQSRCW